MEEELWTELGIDWKHLERVLSRKPDKGRALQRKIIGASFQYLKTRYKLSELYPRDVINNLWSTNPELVKDVYAICNISEKFDEDMIKRYYEQKFGRDIGKPLLFMLLKSLLEDKETIRKIHYATLLCKQRLISAIPNSEITPLNLAALDETNAEQYARQIYETESSRNTINVWYILRDGDTVSIFIYKNCKSRAKIPSTHKRKYSFFEHSRPIILQFSANGNLLQFYAKPAIEQGLKIGSKIASNLASTPSQQITVEYVQEEVDNTKEALNRLINDCLAADPGHPFIIRELTCKPNESITDCDLTFIKNRDALREIVRRIADSLSTTINIDNVSSIVLEFQGKLFTLYFDLRETGCLVKYSAKTFNSEFKQKVKQMYGITVVRKG